MVIVNGSYISKLLFFVDGLSPSDPSDLITSKVMTGLTELNAIQDTWGPEGSRRRVVP